MLKSLLLLMFATSSHAVSTLPKSIYEIPLKTVDGKTTTFSQFKGKTVLVVNTASQCGYTSQYAGLEKLYQKFKDRDFVVVAFPSNDFGGQEPGSNAEIKKFCETRYKTTFPVFEKNPVSGPSKQPLYTYLLANAKEHDEVGWNFEKFIVDKTGRITHRFNSSVEPMSDKLIKALESEL